jgi:hypothetical protein
MITHARAQTGGPNRQDEPVAIAVLDLSFAADRFIDGHVDKVQWAARLPGPVVLPLHIVIINRIADARAILGIGWRFVARKFAGSPATGVGSAQVGPCQTCRVKGV